jgi:hypothetical protein
MGWADLVSIWAFELGDWGEDVRIEFGPEATTTKDLMDEEGVLQARDMALDAIASGDINDPITHWWAYDEDQFWDGLTEGNAATSFLGGYNTTIQIVDNGDGTYTLNYEIENTTSLESGSRLRWGHEGIILNRYRGSGGLHLGGNLNEIWQWSETIEGQ